MMLSFADLEGHVADTQPRHVDLKVYRDGELIHTLATDDPAALVAALWLAVRNEPLSVFDFDLDTTTLSSRLPRE